MLKEPAAARYLADVACEVLLHYPGPMRGADLLRRTAAFAPVDGGTLEAVLGADPRFRHDFGRWALEARQDVAGRPLGGALTALLEAYGKPMPQSLLVSDLVLTRPGAPPQQESLLQRLLATSRDLCVLDECLYLASWLPRLDAHDDQSLFYVNELADDPAFPALHRKLTAASHRQRHMLDTAEAVLKAARVPLHNRALGLILHAHHAGRFDPATVFEALHGDERFLCLSGPAWALAAQERAWLKALAPKAGDEPTTEHWPDAGAILQTPPPQRMRLDSATLLKLQQFAALLPGAIDVAEAVHEVLELRPRQRNYAPAVHAVDSALAGDVGLARIRPGTYLRKQAVPPWVTTVPEALVPVHGPLTPAQAAEALVPLAELPPELAARASDGRFQDLGETAAENGEEPLEAARLTVPWHHYRCGTLPLRARDRRLLELSSPLEALTLAAPDGEVVPVWANAETALIYGLLTWFAENLPPSGGIIALSRSDQPGRLALEFTGETEPAARVSDDRLAELLHLRERLQRRPSALSDAVAAVLHAQARGLSFDALWFQTNIVRRTTRHQLASALVLAGRFSADGARWRAT